MEKRDQTKIKKELEEKESEVLFVIKQDLCKWLNTILDVSIGPDTFIAQLDTGVLLCSVAAQIQQHSAANATTTTAPQHKEGKSKQRQVPLGEIQCNKKAKHESFHARDNTANFIAWCREAGVEESVMFESNGLVMHKDERRVILCLLEVARIAGDVGMTTPKLIELGKEIDSLENGHHEQIDDEQRRERKEDGEQPRQKRRKKDSLETKIIMIFNQCKCQKKLHVVSHGFGKYEITLPSGRKMIIYVRILSDRILVRVGGGWDSIEHFILKHDPCRQGISIKASSLEKEVKLLAPEVVVNVSSSKKSLKTHKKVKQSSQYSSTPSHSTGRHKNNNNDIKCSGSTPSILNCSPSNKRKLN